MQRGGSDLEWLLDYELESAKRYERFVSIVMVVRSRGHADLQEFIADFMRSSDEMFDLKEGVALVMTETDRRGALAATERFKRASNGEFDLRFGVASFPTDKGSSTTLLDKAHRRLTKAVAGDPGSAVANG